MHLMNGKGSGTDNSQSSFNNALTQRYIIAASNVEADKNGLDKTISDKSATYKAASDKAGSDNTTSDKTASDQTTSDNCASDKNGTNTGASSTIKTKKLVKRTKVSDGIGNKEFEIPKLKYSDLGGMDKIIQDIRELIERPFKHPEVYIHLGVDPPRGILLHGPPGCGKTFLASAIAGELGLPILRMVATELVSGMSGESEERIRKVFEQAKSNAPMILFLDEIDAITPKRDTAQKEMERRIVAQLLSCMDELTQSRIPVMVLGATNRPDSLDPALRRAGRFDREIKLGIPDEAARHKILAVVCNKLRLSGMIDLQKISRNTPGYVGADLKALAQEAANAAIQRIFNLNLDPNTEIFTDRMLETLAIEMQDFQVALGKVQPSAKREGFAVVPDISWEDIGALNYIRDELRMAVVEPIRHPEKFAAVGISAPAGVLLWGPPGCGKTLLAKAVANESHSNFISVKGPELLNKYVGESERAVRQVFERARASAPCIIFFDELDALCPRRSDESDSASSRVVNQLLAEMDGLERRKQVFILAATNRPDIIDPAMTRPGRLDKLLYVQLPNAEDRLEILTALSRKTPWSTEVSLLNIANDVRCEGFTGADIFALIREASMAAIRSSIDAENSGTHMQIDYNIKVTSAHVELAFSKITRSVSTTDLGMYEAMRKAY